MKNTRLLLSMLVILCMVFAVAAGVSGDDDGLPTPEPTATPEVTATPEPSASAEPSATPEVTATPEPTPEPTAEPDNLSLSASKTEVYPGQSVKLFINIYNVEANVASGSFTMTLANENATYSDPLITGAENVVWEQDAENEDKYNFTLSTPSAFESLAFIGVVTVTIPEAAPSGELTIATITAGECTDVEGNPIAVTFDSAPIKVTVKENGGKIVLGNKIEATDGFSVVYQSEGNEDIEAVLTLKSDGKTIAVSTEADLTDGITYTAVATCEGYVSGNGVEFTVTDGYYSFEITDMLPGDLDGDNDIDFYDFNNLCTKFADDYDPEDFSAFDLNKDGEINKTDVSALVASWKVGGAE